MVQRELFSYDELSNCLCISYNRVDMDIDIGINKAVIERVGDMGQAFGIKSRSTP